MTRPLIMILLSAACACAGEGPGPSQAFAIGLVHIAIPPSLFQQTGFIVHNEGGRAYLVTHGNAFRQGYLWGDGCHMEVDLPGPGTDGAIHRIPARLCAFDPAIDLALIAIEGKGLPTPIAWKNPPQPAETTPIQVLGMDAPHAGDGAPFERIAVTGTISSVRRGDDHAIVAYQIDALVGGWAEGAPTLDNTGRLIGIAMGSIPGTKLTLVQPAAKLAGLFAPTAQRPICQLGPCRGSSMIIKVAVTVSDPFRRGASVNLRYAIAPPSAIDQEFFIDNNRQGPVAQGMSSFPLIPKDDQVSADVPLPGDATKDLLYVLQVCYEDKEGRSTWSRPTFQTVPYLDSQRERTSDVPDPGKRTATPVPGIGEEPAWIGAGVARPAPPMTAKPVLKVKEIPAPAGEAPITGEGGAMAIRLPFPQEVVIDAVWSANGQRLFVLGKSGTFASLAPPSGPAKMVDLGGTASFLGCSSLGPVVYMTQSQELWLLDEDLAVHSRIAFPDLTCAAVSAKGTLLYAVADTQRFTIIDLAAGRVMTGDQLDDSAMRPGPNLGTDKYSNRLFSHLAISPDGTCLVAIMGGKLARISTGTNHSAIVEIGHPGSGISISPDGRYVGVLGSQPLPGLERSSEPFAYVYHLNDFVTPVTMVTLGLNYSEMAFDPRGKLIFSNDREHQFIAIDPEGARIAKVSFGQQYSRVNCIRVSPAGRAAGVGTSDGIYWVVMPPIATTP